MTREVITIVIFAVSPHYLEALYNEALQFDFSLQGYGNVQDALCGLQYTNFQEIIGFLYLDDTIPNDAESLDHFLSIINKVASGREVTFLFALKSKGSINQKLHLDDYENLKIRYINRIDDVTDLLIRRELFGSLLLEKFEPYQFYEEDNVPPTKEIFKLEFKPLFSDNLLEIMDSYEKKRTSEETLKHDSIYRKLLKFSEIGAGLRKFRILRSLQEDTTVLEAALKKQIDLLEDPTEFCNYNALFNLMKEGGLVC